MNDDAVRQAAAQKVLVNTAIHRALVRELDRAVALDAAGCTEDQRRAVGGRFVRLVDDLHLHHEHEDEYLWPALRRRRPAAAEAVELAEQQHRAIAAAGDVVASAASRLVETGAADGLAELQQAVSAMREVTVPHLEQEERELVPLVVDSLTAEDWEAFEEVVQKAVPIKRLGYFAATLADDADPRHITAFTSDLPPPLRWYVTTLGSRGYRRETVTAYGIQPQLVWS